MAGNGREVVDLAPEDSAPFQDPVQVTNAVVAGPFAAIKQQLGYVCECMQESRQAQQDDLSIAISDVNGSVIGNIKRKAGLSLENTPELDLT